MTLTSTCRFVLAATFLFTPFVPGQQGAGAGFSILPDPTPSPATPQTDAEAEAGRKAGRTLPAKEILRPTVDDAIASFEPKQNSSLKATLTGASSDVTVLLVHTWIDAFKKYYPNVSITVDPPYAGSLGAKELVAGKLDFVVVSRELKPDDITDFQARFHYPPLSVPISGGSYRHYGFLDAVVFFVNSANPVQKLSFAQLDALYSKTHHRGGSAITTWGQLGATGEWADKPVHLYGIKPWNGFEEFVRQRVLSTPGHRGEWRDDITYDKVVFPAAGRVAGDPYGIGFAGLAYVDHPVRILALSPQANADAVSPTYTDVSSAKYPLSRVIYFNTNKAPDKPLNPAVDEFMRFILSREGQAIVQAEGIFLPLRQWQVKESLEAEKR